MEAKSNILSVRVVAERFPGIPNRWIKVVMNLSSCAIKQRGFYCAGALKSKPVERISLEAADFGRRSIYPSHSCRDAAREQKE